MSPILISVVIGFLALDTTIAFQVLLSQPIFACPIIGFLLGNPQLGFEIGLIMQLLWLHIIPAGAATFPEGNVASMVVCAIAIYFNDWVYPNIVFTFAVGIGFVVSYAGSGLTVLDRKLNGFLLDLEQKAAENVKLARMVYLEFAGILIYFILMSLLAFVAIEGALKFIPLFQKYYSPMLETKLMVVKPTLLGIGLMFTIVLIIKAVKNKL